MPLSAGTRLGSYEIAALIGAGGMGEVYRARDTRLGRDVAVKVLPLAFASDPDRMGRFQREAQVLASLNHPNVASIYGLEESAGVRALVMELVEGPTLAERIALGPMPVEEALSMARQIAEAVESAHEKGIIHRDLKPANVKVTADGNVKVLDFGLAKALAGDSTAADPVNSPTLSLANTRAGVILGTAAYMAPEQAKGKSVDRRADIWAFGVLLMEMLTGRQMYSGETASETLAAVIMKEPSLDTLPAATPPSIRRLLRRCLEKDPKRRLQAIGEARIVIEETLAGGSPEELAAASAAVPAASPRSRLPWALAAVCLLAALAFAYAWFRRPAPESPVVKLALLQPEKTSFGTIAVSPDGRRVAFTARDATGKVQLWVRGLDSLSAQPLAGTDGANYPFWSPDSRFIGFFDSNKLKKIEASGGPPQTLCNVTSGRGASWSRDGVILFADSPNSGLFRVPAAGGEARPVTSLDQSRGESSHRWPVFLPGGRHFLYTVGTARTENLGIYLGSLDSKDRTRLLGDGSNAAYATAPSGAGYLLFGRGVTLMAQPFDAAKLRLFGEPFPVAEQVGYNASFSLTAYSVSENGVLVYDSGGAGQDDQLVWFDRGGKRLGTVGEPGGHFVARLSPDEKQVATERFDAQTSSYDLWLTELTRGVSSRFTFDPKHDVFPVWSPDGSRIAFASNRGGAFDLYQKISSGAGKDELLFKSPNWKLPTDWSLDGRFLLYWDIDPKTKSDLWVLPLSGDKKPVPFLQTEFAEESGAFSPDGKWIAYDSDESGKKEVYAQPFPATGAKFQISKGGGTAPKWRRDGKELFYLALDRKIMAVEVKTSDTVQAGIPQPLFDTRITDARTRYAVTRDGQRFLVPTILGEVSSLPATVVLNWTSGIKR